MAPPSGSRIRATAAATTGRSCNGATSPMPAAGTPSTPCKADEGFSVAVRDEHQHWIEDTRSGDIIKDEDGYAAFALINRATGHAIKKSDEAREGPVMLVPYDLHHLDKSVLWSKSGDMMHDFHYIRMVDSICLNLDICEEGRHDKYYKGVQDGTKVMLSYWCDEGV
ncbi:hypothetical protein SEVIR_4G193200v4 [Setaria viridis]|uniref:Uncharacterized protein n=1 Tax=Setaria viridis TaxID=4556 RepID=A0A4U6VAL8_SETVI|nr:ricin B-like lectin R40C1 [Setaria viridis]TKW20967.1 hypothetical protein SEVIR_4G193200v2 [Setaria viridis]